MSDKDLMSVVHVPAGSSIPSIPAPPSSSGTFDISTDIWPEVLQAADWTALIILVVVGGMWMFGNRTPAIQRGIDMGIGYEIIRHAPTILKWLDKF